MKRTFKILTALTLVFALCISFAACTKTSTAMTAEEFAAKAEEKGCEITEANSEKVIAKYWENGNGEVKFNVYEDEAKAKEEIEGWYEGSKQNLYLGGKVEDSNLDPEHYEGYEIDNMLYVFCLYRVDNTMLSIYTFKASLDDVQDFAKSIGYR